MRTFRIILSLAVVFVSFTPPSGATTLTVEEQEAKYKFVSKPAEKAFIEKTPSVDKLVSNVTAGVIQGVDSNPLLDSTKKADTYTEETLDMHFKYPVFGSLLGFTNSKFGFNVTNINYYNITDVNIFDALADVNLEQEIFDIFFLSAGYVFEFLSFPNDENGTFVGNELNTTIRHNITERIYERAAYRLLFRNWLHRKAKLGNETSSDNLRADMRNVFEYELGAYVTSWAKLRIADQFYINNSNDQFFDYYDYINNRVGVSLILALPKNISNITAFYYQRRLYDSRKVSDSLAHQRDNLYLVTTSFLYDLTKDISIFINYSYTENQSNEPLERYSDNLYSAGLYYSF